MFCSSCVCKFAFTCTCRSLDTLSNSPKAIVDVSTVLVKSGKVWSVDDLKDCIERFEVLSRSRANTRSLLLSRQALNQSRSLRHLIEYTRNVYAVRLAYIHQRTSYRCQLSNLDPSKMIHVHWPRTTVLMRELGQKLVSSSILHVHVRHWFDDVVSSTR